MRLASARALLQRLAMRWFLLFAITLLGAGLARAECPSSHPEALAVRTDPLFEKLAASETEAEGMALASRIWSLWATAPDGPAQGLLDKGMQSIQWGAFDEAETALTYLIDYCPDYAEGWNQRAFARFLKADYAGAMMDLDRTLELEPRHFGAIAGRGLTFLKQGEKTLGFAALRQAVAIHPWINERHLLPPEEKI